MAAKGAKGMDKALREANEGPYTTPARPARNVAPPARLGMVAYGDEEQEEALEEALATAAIDDDDGDDDDDHQAGNKRGRRSCKLRTPGNCACGRKHTNVNKATGHLTKYCERCLVKALWANIRTSVNRTTELDPQFVLDNIDTEMERMVEAKKLARAAVDAQAKAKAEAAKALADAQAKAKAEEEAKREAAAKLARAQALAQALRARAAAAKAASDAADHAAIEAEREAELAAAAA